MAEAVREPISLEVVRPNKKTRMGGLRPRGEVVLFPGEDREERHQVPAAVARAMAPKVASGEIDPTSRAEALYEIGQAARSCAARRLEDLLNRRDYAVGEAKAKLVDDGYAPSTIDDVIERAQRGRLLDDKRFADVFIRSKISAGWGSGRIERELSRRGVDVREISGWPEDYLDAGEEHGRAYELASRRRLTGKNDYAKIVRFLVGRGFSMRDATDAAKRVLAEAREADDEY